MKQIIASAAAPAAVGPYSQAVLLNGTLYVSGQLPIVPSTGDMPSSVEEQTRQALTNIGAILREAGMDYDNVVKTTVLLADINDFSAMNAVYAQFFTSNPPARVCFAAKALPKGAKVEIDCVAGI